MISNNTMSADAAAEEITKVYKNTAEETLVKRRICRHSKHFITEELKSLRTKIKEARKNFKKKLQDVLDKYCNTLDAEQEKWLTKKCESLDHTDNNIWRFIDKAVNDHTDNTVQPIRLSTGEYTNM